MTSKKFLGIALFLLTGALFLLTPSTSNAQGTYRCDLLRQSDSTTICILSPIAVNCDTAAGYGPGEECASTPIGDCRDRTYTCITGGSCGGVGEACCPGNACDGNFAFCNLRESFRCEACGQIGQQCCPREATTPVACNPGTGGPEDVACENNICVSKSGGGGGGGSTDVLCGDGINTAIGCIPFGSYTALASFFIARAFGVAGGVAFLLVIFGGFKIMTSQGNPQEMQAGREIITAAIGGLFVVIFSVFILRILGINVLGLF